jgi:hypothetical protein
MLQDRNFGSKPRSEWVLNVVHSYLSSLVFKSDAIKIVKMKFFHKSMKIIVPPT